jgi:hypothetical protein
MVGVAHFFFRRRNWDPPPPSLFGSRGVGGTHSPAGKGVDRVPFRTKGQTLWDSRFICTLWGGVLRVQGCDVAVNSPRKTMCLWLRVFTNVPFWKFAKVEILYKSDLMKFRIISSNFTKFPLGSHTKFCIPSNKDPVNKKSTMTEYKQEVSEFSLPYYGSVL